MRGKENFIWTTRKKKQKLFHRERKRNLALVEEREDTYGNPVSRRARERTNLWPVPKEIADCAMADMIIRLFYEATDNRYNQSSFFFRLNSRASVGRKKEDHENEVRDRYFLLLFWLKTKRGFLRWNRIWHLDSQDWGWIFVYENAPPLIPHLLYKTH